MAPPTSALSSIQSPLTAGSQGFQTPPIPAYLESTYWWAYVRPGAIRFFERDWLVNSILFGNYATLRDAALQALGAPLHGTTLQVACVYGDLTPRLQQRLAPGATLQVLDVVPEQLGNLQHKLAQGRSTGERASTALVLGDSAALPQPDASVDQLLLFFLLHEQPEAVRRATLAEAARVLRPGGKLVIMDYHRPHAWHPLRPVIRAVFAALEPFAIDLWRQPLAAFMPAGALQQADRRTFFGGMYQLEVWHRPAATQPESAA